MIKDLGYNNNSAFNALLENFMNEISKDLLIKDGILNIDKICNAEVKQLLDYMAVRCASHNISFNIYVKEIIESINI